MRVRYVSADRGIPVFGAKGASIHVQEVIRVFRSQGHEVELWTPRIGGNSPADLTDLRVYSIPLTNQGMLEPIALDLQEPAWNRPVSDSGVPTSIDLVYERYSLWGGDAMEWASRNGVPAILEVNAPLIEEHQRHRGEIDTELAHRRLHLAFDHASTIVCVSAPVADWVQSHLPPQRHDQVIVQPNGVDTDRFHPRAANDLPPSSSMEHDDQPSVSIGFVGSLKPWHGVDNLLRAFAEVAKTRASAHLTIIGDGPERESLTTLANELDILSKTTFVGLVAPSQMPELLQDLDIAVAPYPSAENDYFSPLKVFEYLASGLPVVASATGQIPQLIVEGETGFLVPPGDQSALALALIALVDSPELRARVGEAGRAYAVTELTWRSAVTNILAKTPMLTVPSGGRN